MAQPAENNMDKTLAAFSALGGERMGDIISFRDGVPVGGGWAVDHVVISPDSRQVEAAGCVRQSNDSQSVYINQIGKNRKLVEVWLDDEVKVAYNRGNGLWVRFYRSDKESAGYHIPAAGKLYYRFDKDYQSLFASANELIRSLSGPINKHSIPWCYEPNLVKSLRYIAKVLDSSPKNSLASRRYSPRLNLGLPPTTAANTPFASPSPYAAQP